MALGFSDDLPTRVLLSSGINVDKWVKCHLVFLEIFELMAVCFMVTGARTYV